MGSSFPFSLHFEGELEENGLIRDASGYLVARLVDGESFESIKERMAMDGSANINDDMLCIAREMMGGSGECDVLEHAADTIRSLIEQSVVCPRLGGHA